MLFQEYDYGFSTAVLVVFHEYMYMYDYGFFSAVVVSMQGLLLVFLLQSLSFAGVISVLILEYDSPA